MQKFIVIISVTADAVYCHRRGVYIEYLLIQQFTNKWLRKSVYNVKYTFNTFIETIVDNMNKNDATHMDMRNMQNFAHLHAVFSVFV